MTARTSMHVIRIAAAILAACAATSSAAQVQVDPLTRLELPEKPSPHWVWLNDVVFYHMADGKAFLLDGDRGTMLGMLSTGFSFNGVVVPGSGGPILSPETYFSRHTRGERTDVVALYDPRTLDPIGEIPIPPKRSSNIPTLANAQLTDDDRFLLIYNFTPAQSVTVVDTRERKFAGEVDTAGCALVYPTGPRGFFSLCNDGAALHVTLDDQGQPASRQRSAKLFDPERDPVTEKAVRDGKQWLFVSFSGQVVPIDVSGPAPRAARAWSLLDEQAQRESWRPGGMQHLAFHAGTRRLYSLMHVGGPDTHKDPGTEVWVYDVESHKRVQRITLEEPATSIAVTRDDAPLLFAAFIAAQKLDVYDARAGRKLRTITEVGFTPTTLVTW